MNDRSRLPLVLCVAALLALSGCTFGGGVEQGPIDVTVNNAANATHTFDVFLVDGAVDEPDVRLVHRDRPLDATTLGDGLSTYKLDGNGNYVQRVELPANGTTEYGTLALAANESASVTIDAATGSTVVVVVSRDGQAVSLVSVHCGDGAIQYLDVTMRGYGTDSATYCV